METRHFTHNELILKQGDTGNRVYKLEAGEAEVFVSRGGQDIVLGNVSPGEFLGEMCVIGGHQSRSASARAKGEVTVTLLEREQFLEMVSRDVSLAYRVIERLSERLRAMNTRLTRSVSAESIEATIRILPGTQQVRFRLPDDGLVVDKLPFVVGRLTESVDSANGLPDLTIPDSRPYHMSRRHFSLSRVHDDFVVHDLDSTLGTEVNGESVGKHFGRDYGNLSHGENTIVAGGHGSPFAFKIVVEDAL